MFLLESVKEYDDTTDRLERPHGLGEGRDKAIHEMRLPRKVVVGEGVIEKLPEVDDRLLETRKILIITGKNILERLGDKLEAGWDKGQEIKIAMSCEATMSEVERLAAISTKEGAEVILGVGGGRTIDVAKMTAYKLNKDFISIPTAASHDGISSQFVSIKGGGRAYSYETKPPNSIIVDIDVIASAPPRLTASGVGDAISKVIAVRDWRLAHEKSGEYFGFYAAQLALMGADLVMKSALGIGRGEKESVRTLVEALISDGVAAGIAGSSRPCSGSEHLFSHALDFYSSQHALHGEQCGVGTIMMAHLHGLRYEDMRNTLRETGAPTNVDELGVSGENIVKALVLAPKIRPDRYTILNMEKLDESKAKNLARDTGVIP